MRIKTVLFIMWAVLFMLPSYQVQAKTKLLDRIVAVVNDDVVTQSEVDILLRPMFEQYRREYSNETLMQMMDEARLNILNRLVEDKLIYQAAMEQGLEISPAQVEEEFQVFRNNFSSEEEFEQLLKMEHASERDLRDRLRRQLLVRQMQSQNVRAKVVVSPKELEEYYDTHPDEFRTIERVKVRSLTVKKSSESRQKGMMDEEAKAEIAEVEMRYESGDDFLTLVNEYSEDVYADKEGLGDWIERGNMIEAVDEAIFNTPEGKLTEIIETPIGYHLFKVEEKEVKRTLPFEEVREQIKEMLFMQKSEELFQKWVDDLKEDAHIVIKDISY